MTDYELLTKIRDLLFLVSDEEPPMYYVDKKITPGILNEISRLMLERFPSVGGVNCPLCGATQSREIPAEEVQRRCNALNGLALFEQEELRRRDVLNRYFESIPGVQDKPFGEDLRPMPDEEMLKLPRID